MADSDSFAPTLGMPSRLQKRLDDWKEHPPKWQHKAYGPLIAYLSVRFPPDKFLIKAQSLLREEDATPDAGDGDESEDIWTEGHSFSSVDSRGQPVSGKYVYPDFCVNQYWGADDDSNPKADVIRIIMEAGSVGKTSTRDRAKKLENPNPKLKEKTQSDMLVQLKAYMDLAGPQRWDGRLLGIAILGNEAYLLDLTDEDSSNIRDVTAGWISIFDPKFVEEVDWMYHYSIEHDNDD
ncbi:hypothetical protein F5878DRAFT_640803 [Lentinula raphanica]|uniref:Uncharacterized protein n=1 Tax=Lentinula raphanica TaxID=153919 RepID=A0AA38PBK3_9AGAR|nr:hypothetical protein F5878DRAFT_640803 [Lentinula raphanica]